MYGIKLNESNSKKFSDGTNFEFDVPQASVLGYLLFNIDMIVLFYESGNFFNLFDVHTTCPCLYYIMSA